MANYCTWGMPAGWSVENMWQATAGSYYQTIGGQTYKNPVQLFSQARLATSGTPYYFNADEFNIICSSFPSAGGSTDPLISQAAAIQALQAQATGLQAQITAITPWAAASDSGGYMTTDLHLEYFGAVVAFIAVIWCADRIKRYFWREGGDHV